MSGLGCIKIKDLSVCFDGKELFGGLNAVIKKGEKVLVAGSSGSGKSTFLKCMLGFTHFHGDIIYEGKPLCPSNVWDIRSKIAYIPQEPVFSASTVLELASKPFEYAANKHLNFQQGRFDELLERFLLPLSIKNADTEQLSGGEKQRVAIISAILLNRRFMLFDEPTSALDTASRRVFNDILKEISDIKAVVVSHDESIFASFDAVINIG